MKKIIIPALLLLVSCSGNKSGVRSSFMHTQQQKQFLPDNYVERPKPLRTLSGKEIHYGEETFNDAAWRRRREALSKRDERERREAEEWVRAENMVRDIQNNLRNKRYDIIEKHYKE